MPKKKKENNNLNFYFDPKSLKKNKCKTCSGSGQVNSGKEKCPDCGGSGSVDNVNLIQNKSEITKGKPQIKYRIIIEDIEKKKVLYNKVGAGGILVSIEDIINFTAKEVEANFQSAMWGNPLLQRFAIDRIEEKFADNVEYYLDAMENAGLFFSNREQMKEMIKKGNTLQLIKKMGLKLNDYSKDEKEYADQRTTKDINEAEQEFLNKASEQIRKNGNYALISISKDSETTITNATVKGMSLPELVQAILEFSATAILKKENRKITEMDKRIIMMKMIKDIAYSLAKKDNLI